jgi:hypothetical protein
MPIRGRLTCNCATGSATDVQEVELLLLLKPPSLVEGHCFSATKNSRMSLFASIGTRSGHVGRLILTFLFTEKLWW